MYISIKRHSWFFKSWWCLLYFGHVPTRTIGKCWRQKTPFCLKLSAHAQWRQKPPFCLKLSTHAQKSVLSWSISMSRILDTVRDTVLTLTSSVSFNGLAWDWDYQMKGRHHDATIWSGKAWVVVHYLDKRRQAREKESLEKLETKKVFIYLLITLYHWNI